MKVFFRDVLTEEILMQTIVQHAQFSVKRDQEMIVNLS
jgi:hypothetical protein